MAISLQNQSPARPVQTPKPRISDLVAESASIPASARHLWREREAKREVRRG